MSVKNTHHTFGTITKIFHWLLVLLILIQFISVLWVIYAFPENSPEAFLYLGKIHEPFGMLTLIVAILAILWQFFNVHPTFPPMMSTLEKRTARTVHTLLYLCVLVMPITGIIFTVAGGHPPNFFGLYQIPQFMAPNKELSHLIFGIHQAVAYFLIALIALHTLAALKHHYINRDPVLKRML